MTPDWIIRFGRYVRIIPPKITSRRTSKADRKAREDELGAVSVGELADDLRGLTDEQKADRNALAARRKEGSGPGPKFQPDDPGEDDEYPKPAERRAARQPDRKTGR